MKSPTLFLIIFLGVLSTGYSHPIEGTDDKGYALSYLAETELYLISMIRDVDQVSWNYRPSEGKWTIGETAEHILAAEKRLLGQIKKTLAEQKTDAGKKSDIPSFEALLTQLHNRYTYKVKTIPDLEPVGKWISKEEFIKAFQDHRHKLIDFLATTDKTLDQYFTQSPVGTVNLLQYVMIAAGHGARHTLQIEEIKAVLGLKTTTVSFGGRVKVNVPEDQRENIRSFFKEVLRINIEEGERYDRMLFDGGGFVAMVYQTDENMLLPEKHYANAMQVGLLIPAEQYESIRYRMNAYGVKMYQPSYPVDVQKNFYFHAPGGQIFRVIKQEIVE